MFQRITLLSAVLAGVAAAQTQPSGPIIKTDSRLVLVDVYVTNGASPVKNLTKDDFVLEDKGKKQVLTAFDITDAAKAAAAAAPLAPDVVANRVNRKGETQSFATVVLYDKINTAASDQAVVRRQVLNLLAGLKDTDSVGFYVLGFTLEMVRDYNEETAPLARAAKAMLQGNSAPDSFTVEDKALFKKLLDAVSPMQELQSQARVDITYPAFRAVERHLSGVVGRKNLLWITSVFPLTYGNAVERRKNDQAEVDAFKNNLLNANVVIFPVDPGGTGASFNTSAGAPVANEGSLMPGAMRNSANTSAANIVDNSLTGNQTMQILADATGGKAFRNANDITPALREVVASTGYSYTLGFIPDGKTLDGKTHELKVSLVKKPATDKAKVTHRKEYLAWGPKSPPEAQLRPTLSDVMADTLNATGIGMMAVSYPDPMKPGYQKLELLVSGSDLKFEPKGDQWQFTFDMAVGLDGQPGGTQETFSQALNAEQLKAVTTSGLNVGKSINTNGTGGVFHVVIQDKSSGAVGSLRVPFTK
ncbi:MAG: VWA domain-containing protein [Acidobacteriota bacterium]